MCRTLPSIIIARPEAEAISKVTSGYRLHRQASLRDSTELRSSRNDIMNCAKRFVLKSIEQAERKHWINPEKVHIVFDVPSFFFQVHLRHNAGRVQ